jgi:hypothetical protein
MAWRMGRRRWRGRPGGIRCEGGAGADEGGEWERGKKRATPEGRVDGVRDLPYDLGMIVGFGDLWSYSYNHPKHNEER